VLLGAVGLRAVYSAASIPVSMVIVLVGVGLLVLWKKMSPLVGILAGIVIMVALIEFATIGWALALAAVIFVISTRDVLTVVIPVAVVFIFLFWVVVQLRRYLLPGRVVKIVVMAALLLAAAFSLGVGALSSLDTPSFSSNDYRSLQFNDHFYFLSMHSSSDGEWLQLYECNSLGLACREVYSPQRSSYGGRNIALVPDPATNGVAIQMNGETIFTYQPESRKDSLQ
jgi:hypothetical protein